MILYLKNGSGIHIKKKNRGKFTAYCGGNVTSACIAKAKASGNPTLVKRATFAANARKWKHQNGGIISLMPALPILNLKSVKDKAVNFIRQKLYERVDPVSYDISRALSQLLFNGRSTGKNDVYNALWARYLNRSNTQAGQNVDEYLQPANYTITKGKPIGKLYRLTPKAWGNSDDMNPLGNIALYHLLKSGKKSKTTYGNTKTGLGEYTVSLGEDKNGKYMSYYDEWDVSPIGNKVGKDGKDQSMGIGTPFSVYDRRYYTDDEANHIISEYDKMFKSISDMSKNQSIKHDIYKPKPYYKKQKGGRLCLIPRRK